MNIRGEPFEDAPGFEPRGAQILHAEQLPRWDTQALRDREDGRERWIAAAVLYGADVVRGELGALRELLKREAERLASATNRLAERHGRELVGCMLLGERPMPLTSNTIVL